MSKKRSRKSNPNRDSSRMLAAKLHYYFEVRGQAADLVFKWITAIQNGDSHLLEKLAFHMAGEGIDPETFMSSPVPAPALAKTDVELILSSEMLSDRALAEVMNYVAYKWARLEIMDYECFTVDVPRQRRKATEILDFGNLDNFFSPGKRGKPAITRESIRKDFDAGEPPFNEGNIQKMFTRYKPPLP